MGKDVWKDVGKDVWMMRCELNGHSEGVCIEKDLLSTEVLGSILG